MFGIIPKNGVKRDFFDRKSGTDLPPASILRGILRFTDPGLRSAKRARLFPQCFHRRASARRGGRARPPADQHVGKVPNKEAGRERIGGEPLDSSVRNDVLSVKPGWESVLVSHAIEARGAPLGGWAARRTGRFAIYSGRDSGRVYHSHWRTGRFAIYSSRSAGRCCPDFGAAGHGARSGCGSRPSRPPSRPPQ
jgi:hypothetical protein